jgi:proline iminopeptidase
MSATLPTNSKENTECQSVFHFSKYRFIVLNPMQNISRWFHNNPVYHYQTIDVSGGNQLYVEQSGNPQGIPVIYMHGGPGAGLCKSYQWPFNPLKYRVIGVDQRGCGRSTPFGDTNNNTTQLLVEDFETIRQHLGIVQWVVFAGSWGSALALIYAIQYPKFVISMVLRGVFLARKADADWFLADSGGAAQVYPDAYEAFSRHINDTSSSDAVCKQFVSLFRSNDHNIRAAALTSWFDWEGCISQFIAQNVMMSDSSPDKKIRSLALLECHYLLNKCFIEENYIMDNIANIKDIPCHIVHGRYDMVCKLEGAYSLHKSLPQSTLKIVDNAGHSMSELGIGTALTNIMDGMFETGCRF